MRKRVATMKADRLTSFNIEKTCPIPAFDRTMRSNVELIVSLRTRRNILFLLWPKDLLDHIDRFSLAFMIDPHEHLAEEAHSDKLYPDNNQKGSK